MWFLDRLLVVRSLIFSTASDDCGCSGVGSSGLGERVGHKGGDGW